MASAAGMPGTRGASTRKIERSAYRQASRLVAARPYSVWVRDSYSHGTAGAMQIMLSEYQRTIPSGFLWTRPTLAALTGPQRPTNPSVPSRPVGPKEIKGWPPIPIKLPPPPTTTTAAAAPHPQS